MKDVLEHIAWSGKLVQKTMPINYLMEPFYLANVPHGQNSQMKMSA